MAQNNTATDELPGIDTVEHESLWSTAHFDNGAILRYKEEDDGIYEEIFAASDSDSVMESSKVASSGASTDDILANSLDMYDQYDTVEQLNQDWKSLAEWITHE